MNLDLSHAECSGSRMTPIAPPALPFLRLSGFGLASHHRPHLSLLPPQRDLSQPPHGPGMDRGPQHAALCQLCLCCSHGTPSPSASFSHLIQKPAPPTSLSSASGDTATFTVAVPHAFLTHIPSNTLQPLQISDTPLTNVGNIRVPWSASIYG